jgi:hypothetical protein
METFSVTRIADMLVFFLEFHIDILSGGETPVRAIIWAMIYTFWARLLCSYIHVR